MARGGQGLGSTGRVHSPLCSLEGDADSGTLPCAKTHNPCAMPPMCKDPHHPWFPPSGPLTAPPVCEPKGGAVGGPHCHVECN